MIYTGDIDVSKKTREAYATDASSFRVLPEAVYYPKNTEDIVALMALSKRERFHTHEHSLTVRAGGTDMSGGPLSSGWIVDLTRYMHKVTVDPVARTATVEAGAYFRDVEDAAKEHGLMFAAYPSSHRLCGIGGMIGNNASGEKSLRHGPTSDNVLALEVVFPDGTVNTLKQKPIDEATSERERALLNLCRLYGESLREAAGEVRKSASGYRLHKLLDGDTFNEIPLIVGSQGTLGIVTKVVLKLIPIPEHSELLLISAPDLEELPEIISTVFLHHPEGLETFDINTFNQARAHLSKYADRVLPYVDEKAQLFILAQFSESTAEGTSAQTKACFKKLEDRGYFVRHIKTKRDVDAAWQVRRNSFTLMRDYNPEGHKAVPCIEDVIVPRKNIGTFIHALDQILERRKIVYGFHGHIGDGSLRIIPVFDFHSKTLGDDIVGLMQEVFALVKKLDGNMSADHSDGIIRSPFLRAFYGNELYEVFEKIKHLYDPEGILNPGKKIGGTLRVLKETLDR